MIKQILGRLPRKPSSKSAPYDTISKDGAVAGAGTPFMNSSQGPKTVGSGLNNSKASSVAAVKASNASNGASRTSNGSTAPNGGKKSAAVASQGGPLSASNAYEALPSFRDVPSSEKQNIFIRKLNMCCVVFDFTDPSNNPNEKDIKRQTLLELVDYISSVSSKFNEIVMQEITKMLAANLFRTFPSSNHDHKLPETYDLEDEEPMMEPAWPHLQIV